MEKDGATEAITRFSLELAEQVQSGTSAPEAIDNIRERITRDQSIAAHKITSIVNKTGWNLLSSGRAEMSEKLIRGLSESE